MTRSVGFKLSACPKPGCGWSAAEPRDNLEAEALRATLTSVTPKPDSPHIPHDKVTIVTNSCHKPLSECHHHPPTGRFRSSLGHNGYS